MRHATLLFAPLLALATLTSCSNDNASEGASAGELNLYSSRHYDTDIALYENFTEATGIKINLIEASIRLILMPVASVKFS